MSRQIVILQGHPDPQGGHYDHALADAYAQGAQQAGHQVSQIEIAKLDFPLLRSKEEFEHGSPPTAICQAQDIIRRADHLVIVYPLWLGAMPALLKGFLEQVFRPGFVTGAAKTGSLGKRTLRGKSARIVITMGMPAFIYRWFYGAYTLKSLERNILKFCGIGPCKESLIGMVEAKNDAKRKKWLAKMRAFGRKGM